MQLFFYTRIEYSRVYTRIEYSLICGSFDDVISLDWVSSSGTVIGVFSTGKVWMGLAVH